MRLWFSATGQRTVQNCDSPNPQQEENMWCEPYDCISLMPTGRFKAAAKEREQEQLGVTLKGGDRGWSSGRPRQLEILAACRKDRAAQTARAPGGMLEGHGCRYSAPRTCRGDAFVFGWRLIWMNSWEQELKLHEDGQKRTESSKVRNSWSCMGQKVSARGETS